METKQVQYFLSIVENGSFSLAAEELFISQSSLSKQIIALEKELGFPLFDRSKRKISLTEAGEKFLNHATRLNEVYKSMLADLVEYTITPMLSIAAIPVIAQYGITAIIAQYRNEYPKINFVLEEREASTILPALENGQFDLAFLRDNYLDTNLFLCRVISRDRLIVLVSREHRFASRTLLSLAELANENFILFDKGTIVHELSVDACRRAGFEPHILYASLRVESIISMVASNTGVALMMEKVSDYHKQLDVVIIPLEQPVESNIVLAYPRNKKLPKAAKAFVELIEKNIGNTRKLE
jgi:LysR family transcriptional regulator, transcription activator of glutamate synthase operon